MDYIIAAVFITLYLLLCIGVGVIADNRYGREDLGWAIFSFFVTPLLAALLLTLIGLKGKNCPHCLEIVRLEATTCKHCLNKIL